MKREALLSIVISCISLQASSQGYIDIDTNIQMGMVNSEHVKITSSAFNIHSNDPTQPLIFGDFGNGNVGIGTDSPDVKLTVFRDSPGVISRFASSSVGLIGLRIQGEAAGGTTSYLDLAFDPDSKSFGFGAGENSGQLPINSGFSQADLVITDSGRVGIGKSDPDHELEVAGDIEAQTYITDNSTVMAGAHFIGAGGSKNIFKYQTSGSSSISAFIYASSNRRSSNSDQTFQVFHIYNRSGSSAAWGSFKQSTISGSGITLSRSVSTTDNTNDTATINLNPTDSDQDQLSYYVIFIKGFGNVTFTKEP